MLADGIQLFDELLNLFRGNEKTVLIPMFLGGLIVVILPILHFGVLYKHILLPEYFTSKLDVYFCSNTCWDGVFKVGYEKVPAGYKHIYFNVTTNTMLIWIITVCAVIALYESAKYLLKLRFRKGLRLSMAWLFICGIYSHYYTWWSYFNYLNDDFYTQWLHQLIFSLTELLSSVVLLYLCNNRNELKPRLLLMVINVAAFHSLASCWDQFVTNVLLQKGDVHQWPRDLGLMIPDLLNIAIPCCLLHTMNKRSSGRDSHHHGSGIIIPQQEQLKLPDYIASFILVSCLLLFTLLG